MVKNGRNYIKCQNILFCYKSENTIFTIKKDVTKTKNKFLQKKLFKGTVSVSSNDPLFIEIHVRITTVPCKPLSGKL